ncbi:MAG: hypothetical protein P8J45_03360 [Phycisphaerales bacterium]|nr:hypothetical protein [Phycisphaerales bacterium]
MTHPEDLDSLQDLEQDADPRETSAEQFAHGLLGTHYEDATSDQARVRNVMSQIRSEQAAPVASIRPFSPWGIASGIAAILFFGFGFMLLNATQQTATATITQAINATILSGDRSYMVTTIHGRGVNSSTLDVRSDDQYVFRTQVPEGHLLVAGVDESGQWMLRRDNTIERTPVPHHQPRWIDLGGRSLMMTSFDGLLAALPGGYELELLDPEPLEEGGAAMVRVSAAPKNTSARGPKRIELWLDPDTHLIQRMRLVHAPSNARPPKGAHRPPMNGPGHRRPPRPAPEVVEFDLLEQQRLPPDWFSPEAHMTP